MIVVAVIQNCAIFKMPSVEQAVAAAQLEKAAYVSSDEHFTKVLRRRNERLPAVAPRMLTPRSDAAADDEKSVHSRPSEICGGALRVKLGGAFRRSPRPVLVKRTAKRLLRQRGNPKVLQFVFADFIRDRVEAALFG